MREELIKPSLIETSKIYSKAFIRAQVRTKLVDSRNAAKAISALARNQTARFHYTFFAKASNLLSERH